MNEFCYAKLILNIKFSTLIVIIFRKEVFKIRYLITRSVEKLLSIAVSVK